MTNSNQTLPIFVTGSSEFKSNIHAFRADIRISELYQIVSLSNSDAPCILLIEIGRKTSAEDVQMLRSQLERIKREFKQKIFLILALTSTKTYALAGTLLFSEDENRSGSCLVNDIIIYGPSRGYTFAQPKRSV